MAEFNLSDVLANAAGRDLGQPGREQIEYVDIDLISSDKRNFYELSGVEDLAANIETIGLQQPLRLRPDPDASGGYIIVSGHRRRAALQLLVDEGKDRFRAVPSIIEQAAGSEALQELRLIFANSDTRKMTSYEISKQSERVQWLLYKLADEGVIEFSGRMRDLVAEACKVSKSKLSRLKVIRDHLDPSIMKYYEKDKLKESPAYELAKLPAELQRMIFNYEVVLPCRDPDIGAYTIKTDAALYSKWSQSECKKTETGKCTHAAKVLEKHGRDHYAYHRCDHTKCCSSCLELAKCKYACPLLADKAKKLKAEQKEARKKERAAAALTDAQEVEKVKNVWARFGEARTAAGKSTKEVYAALGDYWTDYFEQRDHESESGTGKIHKSTMLPYGIHIWDAQKLIVVADMFGVTTDYLLGRAGTTEPVAVWHDAATGDLPEDGESVIAAVQYDVPHGTWVMEDLRFRDGKFRAYGTDMPDDCRVFWQPSFDPKKIVP